MRSEASSLDAHLNPMIIGHDGGILIANPTQRQVENPKAKAEGFFYSHAPIAADVIVYSGSVVTVSLV